MTRQRMRRRRGVGAPDEPVFGLPPFITASTWTTAFNAMYSSISLLGQRTTDSDGDGSTIPRITNREAMAIISEWRTLAPLANGVWPLWYQYAAQAYAWDPSDPETAHTLVATDKQADAIYPPDMGVELWRSLRQLAHALDDNKVDAGHRLDFDRGAFDDPTIQGEVVDALKQDGATVTTQGRLTDFIDAVKKGTKDTIDKVKDETDRGLKMVKRNVIAEKLGEIGIVLVLIFIATKLGKTKKRRRR